MKISSYICRLKIKKIDKLKFDSYIILAFAFFGNENIYVNIRW